MRPWAAPRRITRKGGVLIDLGGQDAQDALLLEAHADTLGAMVAEIKGNGRLRVTNLGGMRAENGETENVTRIYPRRQGDRRHAAAVQRVHPCKHQIWRYQA